MSKRETEHRCTDSAVDTETERSPLPGSILIPSSVQPRGVPDKLQPCKQEGTKINLTYRECNVNNGATILLAFDPKLRRSC